MLPVDRTHPQTKGEAMSRHTPGPLCDVPIPERVQRIVKRLRRRVYHRIVGDYANAGINLCDIVRLRVDLNLGAFEFQEVFGDCGLSGPPIEDILAAEEKITAIESARATQNLQCGRQHVVTENAT